MALDLWCINAQETGQEEDRLVQGVTSKGNQLQLFNPSIVLGMEWKPLSMSTGRVWLCRIVCGSVVSETVSPTFLV
jgi:hypothetical protein